MTLYALDDLDDAIAATQAFLWPFDLGLWAKLALLTFFVGGVGGTNPLQFGGSGGAPTGGGPNPPGAPAIPESIPTIGGPEFAIIVTVLSIVFVLGVLFLLIGSIVEFVFVESLRREEVAIRRYWSEYWGRGLRLFGFRLLLGALAFGFIGLLGAVVLAPVLFGTGELSLVWLPVVIVLGGGVAALSGLINGFTTVFVVPIMMVEERGLLSSWRQFWPVLTGQWRQYLVYAIAGFILQIAGGIAAIVATAIAALVVAIPLGIVGVLGAGLLSISQIAGWTVIAVAAALFVLALIIIVLFTAVPVQTFLRYYALFVLGDTDGSFDLIPARRRTVREYHRP